MALPKKRECPEEYKEDSLDGFYKGLLSYAKLSSLETMNMEGNLITIEKMSVSANSFAEDRFKKDPIVIAKFPCMKILFDSIAKRINDKVGKITYVLGPLGVGKSYSMLYNLIKFRKDPKYRVVYVSSCLKLTEDNENLFLLYEILYAFGREIQSRETFKFEGLDLTLPQILVYFLNLESSDRLNEYPKLFNILNRYCIHHDLKFIMILDQFNEIASIANKFEPSRKLLRQTLEKCPVTHQIISYSNSETMKKPEGIIPLEVEPIKNVVIEDVVMKDFVKYILGENFEKWIHDMDKPEGILNIEDTWKEIVSKLREVTGFNLLEISEYLNFIVSKGSIKGGEDAYVIAREKEYKERVVNFQRGLKELEGNMFLNGIAQCDINNVFQEIYIIHPQIMYEKGGIINSICPIAKKVLVSSLLAHPKKADPVSLRFKLLHDAYNATVETKTKGNLFEEFLTLFFRENKGREMDWPILPDTVTEPAEMKSRIQIHFVYSQCTDVKRMKSTEGLKFFKDIFKGAGNRAFLGLLYQGFPDIDFLIYIEIQSVTDETIFCYLYPIQATANIEGHYDSFEHFFGQKKPKEVRPPIYKAFEEAMNERKGNGEKIISDVTFVWMIPGVGNESKHSLLKSVRSHCKEHHFAILFASELSSLLQYDFK